MAMYDAYDKNSDKQGLGWADQWDYKYNDQERDAQGKGAGNKPKLAKVKQAASAGVDKTKQAVSSGASKVKTGTASGINWIKQKVQKKPQT